MAEYIKREDAYTTLTDYYHHSTETQHMALKEALDRVPAADVVERKIGKWIIKWYRDNPGTGWYRVTCSACGEDVTSTAPVIGFFPNAKITWNYCPECGSYNGGDDDV